MNTILFIDKNVSKLEVLINSIKVQYYLNFEFQNIDYTNISRFGFLWQNSYGLMPFGLTQTNYKYFTDEFLEFLNLVATKPIIVDLITCDFKEELFVNEVASICAMFPNLTLNYSIDQTGNNDLNSDWIMESSGEDIEPIYFNSNISNYDVILDIQPLFYNSTTKTSIDFANGNKIVQYSSGFTDISEYGGLGIPGIITQIFDRDQYNLPFIFTLNNISYTKFSVGTHTPILLTFDGNVTTNDDPNNNDFRTGTYIMPLWTRLDSSTKKYFVPDNTPNYLIIQYDNLRTRNSTSSGSFSMQVILYQNGSIEFKYKDLASAGITTQNSTRFITGVFTDNNLYYTFNVNTQSFDRKNTSGDISGSYFTAINSNLTKLTNYTYNRLDGSDLSNYNFSGLNLTLVNFSSCNLTNVDLSGTTLDGAFLESTNLSNTIISNTSFYQIQGTPSNLPSSEYTIVNNTIFGPKVKYGAGTDLSGYNLSDINLSGSSFNTNLTSANLTNSNLANTTLTNSNLTNAILNSVYGKLANTTGTTLPSGYVFRNNYIVGPGVNLINADLSGVDLSGIDLSGADLSGANLTNVSGRLVRASGAVLPNGYVFRNNYVVGPRVNLTGADLSGVSLSGINLDSTNLTGANLTNVSGQLTSIVGTILPTGYVFKNNYVVGPNVDLRNSNLSAMDLSNINISGSNLSGAILTNVSGRVSNTTGTTLPSGYVFRNNYIVGPNVNLTNTDLSGVDLSGVDLSGTTLTGATLTNVSGRLLNTTGATLPNGYVFRNNYIVGPNVNLINADLSGIDLSGVNISNSDLSGATLTNISGQIANISGTILPNRYVFKNSYILGPNVNLSGVDLSGVDLSGINLSGANLSGAILTNISGRLSDITGTILSPPYEFKNNYIVGPNVNLTNADFSGISLSGVNLNGSNLTGANLTNVSGQLTSIVGTILPTDYVFKNDYILGPNVNLSSADLSGVELSGINLSGADLNGAILTNISGRLANISNSNLPFGYIFINNYIIGPYVNLVNADLSGYDLAQANLTQVKGQLASNPSTLPVSYYNFNRYIVGPNVNLSAADLSNSDLSGISLANSNLLGAIFTNVSGQLADVSGAVLSPDYLFANRYIVGPGVNLSGVDLSGFDLSGYSLANTNLTQVRGRLKTIPNLLPNNYDTRNRYIVGPYVDLVNADLSGTDLSGVDLSGADLSGAILNDVFGQLANQNAILSPSYKFANSYIVGPGVNLSGVDLSGFDLSGYSLVGATLIQVRGQLATTPSNLPSNYYTKNNYIVGPNVILSDADLTNVDLSGVDLSGADLSGAVLSGVFGQLANQNAILSPSYKFERRYIVGPGVNLSGVDVSGFDLSGYSLADATLIQVRGQLATEPFNLPTNYYTFNRYIVGPNVNLSEADLTNSDLSSIVISEADLSGAVLNGVFGQLADVSGAVLSPNYKFANRYIVGPGVNLSGVNLSGFDLSGYSLANANLTQVRGQLATVPSTLPTDYYIKNRYIVGPNVNLSEADLSNSNFSGIDISGSNLSGAILTNVLGRLSNTTNTTLPSSYVFRNNYIVGPNVNLQFADLSSVDLSGVNLFGVDLSGATLNNVSGRLLNISGAILPNGYVIINNHIVGPNVNLSEADLSNSNLSGVDLSGADLSGAVLSGVYGQLANQNAILSPNYKFESRYIMGPGVNLTSVDLSGADLSGYSLNGATLIQVRGQLTSVPSELPAGYFTKNNYIVGPNVNLQFANLLNANLSNISIVSTDLSGAVLNGVFGQLTDVSGAVLSPSYKFANRYIVGPGVDLSGVDLSGFDLSGYSLANTNLTQVRGQLASRPTDVPFGYSVTPNLYIIGPNVDLDNADLSGINLSGVDLSGADLSGAVLTGVYGQLANQNAILSPSYKFERRYIVGPGVDLSGVDVSGFDLSGYSLAGANLTQVRGQLSTPPLFLPTNYSTRNNYIVGTNVNLSEADLTNSNLSGIDLSGANLSGATLSGVYGQLANQNAVLSSNYKFERSYIVGPGVNLSGVDLTDFNLSGYSLVDANLTQVRGQLTSVPSNLPAGYFTRNNYIVGPNVNLSGADLTNTNLNGISIANTNLSGAVLNGVSGQLANVSGAVLSFNYRFANSYIVGPNVNLRFGNLSGVDFSSLDLTGADLSGAVLTNVRGQLASVPLVLPIGYNTRNLYIVGPNVNLSNANLSNSNLGDVDLSGADLSGAILSGVYGQLANQNAILSPSYKFESRYIVGPNVDLSGVDVSGFDLSGYSLAGVNLTQVRGQLSTRPLFLPTNYSTRNSYIVGPKVNLSSANLNNSDLSGIDLSGADLSGATLSGVLGQLANQNATLSSNYKFERRYIVGPGVNLSGVDLSGFDLSGYSLEDANLTQVRGQLASVPSILPADYYTKNNYIVGPNVSLSNADLSNSDLSGISIVSSDLSGAVLSGVSGQLADVSGAVLAPNYRFANRYIVGPYVNLRFGDLSGVDFSGVDFTGADLSGAVLTNVEGQLASVPLVLPIGYNTKNRYIVGPNVNLSRSDLSNSNLSDVDLSGADLSGAVLSGVYGQLANQNAILSPSYKFESRYIVGPNVDLSGVDVSGFDLSGYRLIGVNLTQVRGQLSTLPLDLPSGYSTRNNYIVGPKVNLSSANLNNSDLGGIDLSGADLSGATLSGVYGQLANQNAVLSSNYKFERRYIVGPGVDLSGVDLSGFDLSGYSLADVNLTQVRGQLASVPSNLPAGYFTRNNYIVGPNVSLSSADLSNSDLSGISIVSSDLSGAVLSGVSGQLADVSGAVLAPNYRFANRYIIGPNVNLSSADLTSVDFSGADLSGADLSGAVLTNVRGQLKSTPFALPVNYTTRNRYIIGPNVNLSEADLSNSNLSSIVISGADLSGALLSGVSGQLADVSGTVLAPNYRFANRYIVGPNVNLSSADLSGVDFSAISIVGSDLSGAILTDVSGQLADVSGAVLAPNYRFANRYIVGPNVNLSDADLSGVNFSGADLSGADLSGAVLTNVRGQLKSTPLALPVNYNTRNRYIIGPNVNLSDADLTNSNLSSILISNADLSGAVLSGVFGQLADVSGAVLAPNYRFANRYIVGPNVDLSGVDVSGFDLSGYSLISANLTQVKGQLSTLPLELPSGYSTRNNYIVGPKVNLSSANLTNSDLSGIDLSGADLSGATLSGVLGQLANQNAVLSSNYKFERRYIVGPGVNLSGVDLSGFDLSGYSLADANLTQVRGQLASVPSNLPAGYYTRNRYIVGPNVNLSAADLTSADFSAISIVSSDLSGAILIDVSGQLADVSGAVLAPNYRFANRYIVGPNVNLRFGDLSGVDFSGVDLSGADLSGAVLTNVRGQLRSTPFALPVNYNTRNRYIVGPNVNLSAADLSNSDLSGVNLFGADLSGAILSGVLGQLSDVSAAVLAPNYKFANRYIVGPDVNLSSVDLNGFDLSGYSLANANLRQVRGRLATVPSYLPTSYSTKNRYIVGPNVNLSEADLSNSNLTDVDLSGADLSGAMLSGVLGRLANQNAILSPSYKFANRYIVGPGVNLSSADLSGINFSSLDISLADLSGAILTNVYGQFTNINGAILSPKYVFRNNYIVGPKVNLSAANLTGVNFSGLDLSGTDLSGATLTNIYGQFENISGVILSSKYVFRNNYIVGPSVNLLSSDLSGIDLSGIDISGSDLSGAILTNVRGKVLSSLNVTLSSSYVFKNNYIVGPYVNLSSADLTGSNMSEVNLTEADLSGAILTNINGQLSQTTNAKLPNRYVFRNNYIAGPNVDLSGADLSGFDLSGINLSGANLKNINFTNANLSDVLLTNAITGPIIGMPSIIPEKYFMITNSQLNKYLIGPGVNLNSVNLSGVDLTDGDITDGDLSGVDISGINLSGVDISGINFFGVKMGPIIGTPINLDASYNIVSNNVGIRFIIGPNVIIDNCDLTNADLSNSNLIGIRGNFIARINPKVPSGYLVVSNALNKKNIVSLDISSGGGSSSGIVLSKMNLNNADLGNAIIPKTASIDTNSFFKTNFTDSTIKENKIDYAMFVNSTFDGCNFTDTIFNRCVFINCTVTPSTNMTGVVMKNCYIKNSPFNTLVGITYINSTYI